MRAGSPDSSRWWETKDFAEFTEVADAHPPAGDLAEARDLSTGSILTMRLHLELTELERATGARVSVMLAENFRTRNSLIHFRRGLGGFGVVTQFLLGISTGKRLSSKLYPRLLGLLDPADTVESRVGAGLLEPTQPWMMTGARQATGGGR